MTTYKTMKGLKMRNLHPSTLGRLAYKKQANNPKEVKALLEKVKKANAPFSPALNHISWLTGYLCEQKGIQ